MAINYRPVKQLGPKIDLGQVFSAIYGYPLAKQESDAAVAASKAAEAKSDVIEPGKLYPKEGGGYRRFRPEHTKKKPITYTDPKTGIEYPTGQVEEEIVPGGWEDYDAEGNLIVGEDSGGPKRPPATGGVSNVPPEVIPRGTIKGRIGYTSPIGPQQAPSSPLASFMTPELNTTLNTESIGPAFANAIGLGEDAALKRLGNEYGYISPEYLGAAGSDVFSKVTDSYKNIIRNVLNPFGTNVFPNLEEQRRSLGLRGYTPGPGKF